MCLEASLPLMCTRCAPVVTAGGRTAVLVTLAVTPTVPVTVSYELTELGLSLHAMIRGVESWAKKTRVSRP